MLAMFFIEAAGFASRFLATETTCSPGQYDCAYLTSGSASSSQKNAATCAPYDDYYKSVEGNYGLLVFAAIGMAIMAFSIGANDAANAWATVVHSYAMPLKYAVILGAILETLGATTLGYGVSTSLQKGISDYKKPNCFACGYCDSKMTEYYVGMMSALYGAGCFVLVASYFKMPVSTSHAIVGGVIGMTVSSVGFGCLAWGWSNLGGIIASWVISPVASGCVGLLLYLLTEFLIFRARNPRVMAMIALPVLYFGVVFTIAYLSVAKAPVAKGVDPMWGPIAGTIGGGAAAVLVVLILLPYVKRNMPSVNSKNKLNFDNLLGRSHGDGESTKTPVDGAEYNPAKTPTENVNILEEKERSSFVVDSNIRRSGAIIEVDSEGRPLEVIQEYEKLSEEQQDAMWMFKYLLIVVASLDAYAHGSNDTANATAALSAVINGFKDGNYSCSSPDSQWWIMLIGGAFLGLGVLLMGYRVMDTLGRDLSIFNYQRGFCAELASAITVVTCSVMKLPVSSTHCQVGAVIFIGIGAYGLKRVQWKLIGGIVAAWLVTVPTAALVSALLTYLIQFAFRT